MSEVGDGQLNYVRFLNVAVMKRNSVVTDVDWILILDKRRVLRWILDGEQAGGESR